MGARQPVPLVVGVDVADHDRRIAQLRAQQDGLQTLHQSAVAAPVGGQCPLVAGGLRRAQVGDDVTAAKRINRLLRSPISTSVDRPLNARSITCHCTGSVSWNSSTITMGQR